MEKAEFVVDTSDWKTFFKMSYDGNVEKLWKFGFLVDGTVHLKLGKLNPDLKDVAKQIAGEVDLGDALKEITRKVKRAARKAGVAPRLVEMWLAREVLAQLGLKTYPELREVKKILKEI